MHWWRARCSRSWAAGRGAWVAAPLIAIIGTWVIVQRARLDIGFVRLAQPASDLFDPGFRLPLLSIDLELADVGSSFADSFKKLLVFYDGPVDLADQCAVSFNRPRIGGARSMTGIWLRASAARDGWQCMSPAAAMRKVTIRCTTHLARWVVRVHG